MTRALGRWVVVAALIAAAMLSGHASAQERPRPTPLTPVALARALYGGHRDAFAGKKPSGHRLAVAWAQTALETGSGAKTRGFDVGNVGGRARAFRSAREGATAYWRAVQRCEAVLPFFDAGDAAGAAHQLARCGYYRADPAVYASGMASLRAKFTRTVWPRLKGLFGH